MIRNDQYMNAPKRSYMVRNENISPDSMDRRKEEATKHSVANESQELRLPYHKHCHWAFFRPQTWLVVLASEVWLLHLCQYSTQERSHAIVLVEACFEQFPCPKDHAAPNHPFGLWKLHIPDNFPAEMIIKYQNKYQHRNSQERSDLIISYPNHATDPFMFLSIAQPSCQDQFYIAYFTVTALYLSGFEKGFLYGLDDDLTWLMEESHLSFLEFDTMILVRTWIFIDAWKYGHQFPSAVRMSARVLQIANWCCTMIRNDQYCSQKIDWEMISYEHNS